MAFPIRHRLANVLIDAGLVALAWYAAFFFRFEELPVWAEKIRDEGLWRVVLIKVVVFIALGLYPRWWRYVSLRDLFHVVRACVAASVAGGARARAVPHDRSTRPLPRGVIAFDFVFTLLALIAARALARTIFERPRPGFLLPTGREVLVIGAGEAGQLVVREMLKKRSLGYSPTRLLDDDPRKQGMRLRGRAGRGPHDRPRRHPRELAARRGRDRDAGRRAGACASASSTCAAAAACRSRRCRASTSCSTATSTCSSACARCRWRTCWAARPCSSTSPPSAAT